MSVLEITTPVVLAMLGIAAFLTVIRLLRGPTLPDRVIALDLLSTLAVGIIATYAIATGVDQGLQEFSLARCAFRQDGKVCCSACMAESATEVTLEFFS